MERKELSNLVWWHLWHNKSSLLVTETDKNPSRILKNLSRQKLLIKTLLSSSSNCLWIKRERQGRYGSMLVDWISVMYGRKTMARQWNGWINDPVRVYNPQYRTGSDQSQHGKYNDSVLLHGERIPINFSFFTFCLRLVSNSLVLLSFHHYFLLNCVYNF